MKRYTWKAAIASLMVMAMTVTVLPAQILSGLIGKPAEVNADGNNTSRLEIGTDDPEVMGEDDLLPAYGYYNYGYSEQIYTAAEVGNDDMDIGAIAFYVSSAHFALNGEIYLCDTDKTDFSGSNDTIPLSDATLVYKGDLPFDQSGWVTLVFNKTAFYHSKDKNLAVITVNTTGKWQNSHSSFAVFDGDNNCAVLAYTDDGRMNPGDYSSNFSQSNQKNCIQLISTTEIGTVSYMANDGTYGSCEQLFERNSDFQLNAGVFVNPFFEFDGWNTDPYGNGVSYESGETVNFQTSITLYAQWIEVDYLTVGIEKYQTNEGPVIAFSPYSYSEQIYTAEEIGDLTSVGAISFKAVDSFAKPCSWSIYLLDTDKESFDNKTDFVPLDDAVQVFDGTFTVEQTGWFKIDFDIPFYHNPQKNLVVITINRSGQNDNNVNFAFYEGQAKCLKYDYSGESAVIPGVSANSNGIGVFDYKNVIRLYPSEADAITVTCKANGSGEEDEIYAVASGTFTLKQNTFSYDGHVFTGWNTEADGSGEAYGEGDTLAVTSDVVLYAQWDSVPTIWYNSNDGTDNRVAQTIGQESTVILNNCFFNLHYQCVAWNTQEDGQGTSYMPGDEVSLPDGTQLYAQWVYSEIFFDFSKSALEDGWVFIDSDHDGHNWLIGTQGKKSHSRSEIRDGSVIYSQSFENNVGAYTPDNWAISPMGFVDPEGSLTVSLWAIAERENYPDEHFAIYVAEADSVDLGAFDASVWKQISPEYVSTEEWTEYTGNMAEYAGKYVYVAIRHFNCEDEYELVVDDVTLPFLNEMGEHLYGYSVSLDGDIAVNYYMRLDEEIINSPTAEMVFTVPSGSDFITQTVKVSDVLDTATTVGNKTCYVFKCKVSAKDMASTITAQLVDGERSGKTYSYSVKQYAEYLINHPNNYDTDDIDLVKALLNYGARAQIYFDVNTSNLAYSALTKTERDVVTNISADEIKPYTSSAIDLPDGVTFVGATLSLKSETTLSLYFTSEDGVKLEFACDGKTVETKSSGNYQIARIRGINAKELLGDFTVTVTAGEVSGEITYSAMTYCYNVLNGNYEENLQNVCKSLFRYGLVASGLN